MDNTVSARRGALQTLYLSGGVIPDRGYFHLRHQQTNARIGELDEEFVWEAAIGDTFSFGTQNWRIEKITHNDVLVLQETPRQRQLRSGRGKRMAGTFTFPKGSDSFSKRRTVALRSRDFADALESRNCMDAEAVKGLIQIPEEPERGDRLFPSAPAPPGR